MCIRDRSDTAWKTLTGQMELNEAVMTDEEKSMWKMAQALRENVKLTDLLSNTWDNAGGSIKAAVGSMSTLVEGLGGVSFSSVEMGNTFTDSFANARDAGATDAEATKQAWLDVSMAIMAAGMEALSASTAARISALQEQGQAELDTLKSSERYAKLSAKQKKIAEDNVAKETNKAIKKQFEKQKAMKHAAVIMDTAAAIMNMMANIPAPANIAMSVIAGIMGAAQLAAIDKEQAPTMAAGGLIGGNLHSQGGTMIEAEQGEYIMNRNAVNSIGVENMNRINQGGMGGSPVNISFSGNINSDDFIESEAIPKIKEAIRRGADIGVS